MKTSLVDQLILFALDLLRIRVHIESCQECKRKYEEMLAHAKHT
jgi:hypothetical protein